MSMGGMRDATGYNFEATALDSMTHVGGITISCWILKTAAEWDQNTNWLWTFMYDLSVDVNRMWCTSQHDRISSLWRETGTNQQSHTDQGVAIGAGEFDDIWVPVTVVYASDIDKTVYVETTRIAGTTNTSSRQLTALDQFRVGKANDTSVGFFDGKIAEIAIWDKGLSNAEVDSLWTSEGRGPKATTIAAANLVGYWPFDVDSDTQVDESGTGNASLIKVGGENRQFFAAHPIITGGDEQLSMGGVIITP